MLRAQQQQQQQQLQMAAELTRMKFFQALQQQQMEGVGVRDYVLFIDKSGSMAGGRWQEARKAIESLAPQLAKVFFFFFLFFFLMFLVFHFVVLMSNQACPQGSSLYFFNDQCTRIDNVTTAAQVHEYFGKEKPGG